MVYFGTSTTRDVNPAEGEKRDGFKWFTRDELLDKSFGVGERVQRYAIVALETVNGA